MTDKKNIIPVVVLAVICVIVAALLGLINALTKPIIDEAEQERVYASFKEALDGNFETLEHLPERAPTSVTKIFNVTDYATGNLIGNVVTVTVKGYKDNISLTVGVDTDGRVTKAIVTSEAESHGKKEMESFTDRFTGKDASESEAVEVVSGATVTSNAIKGAINDALVALGYAEAAPELPRTDEELIALAKGLVDGEFKDVTPKDADGLVKRVYREINGGGYVVYVHTYAQYGGGLETETLIAVDKDGAITGIENLLWVVGHDENDTPPAPSKEAVESFFEGFVGKNRDDVNSVELVTNATGTAMNVRLSVAAALDAIPNENYLPRILGISALSVAAIASAAFIILKKKRRAVK